MNTMKSFYAAISSVPGPRGSYLDALAKISQIKHNQANALKSDLGWQEWAEQKPKTATV